MVWPVIVSLLIVISIVLFGWVLYIKFKAKKYTRERFAFYAVAAIVTIFISTVTTLFSKSPFDVFVKIYVLISGNDIETESIMMSLPEKILLFIFSCFVIGIIFKFWQNWNGIKSEQQYQNERKHKESGIVIESIDELLRIFKNEGMLPECEYKETSKASTRKVEYSNKLVWYETVRELMTLRYRDYSINSSSGWHQSESCWVGLNKKNQRNIAVLVAKERPTEKDLERFADYIGQVTDERLGCDYFVAVKHGAIDEMVSVNEVDIYIISKKCLFDGLIDFSDYFDDIIRKVEVDFLPDSSFTLLDTYTTSFLSPELNATHYLDKNLEEFLSKWLSENSLRQVAILGEYGQGKSTGALMYAYSLIKKTLDEGFDAEIKIPILIELRGKSPSTLSRRELLGAWASSYKISPVALDMLLQDGRLFLIFEGFDEMHNVATSTDREAHFRSLWSFYFPGTKILFTGRPNLFLDDNELKHDLEVAKSVSARPYCEAMYLTPFSLDQIESSLRYCSEKTKEQILLCAQSNFSFNEIISRPSLLYLVSQLWEPTLQSYTDENINSAEVIGLFIKNCSRRQVEKHSDERQFMVLGQNERAFFEQAIASFMMAGASQNQISIDVFSELIGQLYDALPEDIIFSESVMALSPSRPLKQRFIDHPDPIEAIATDVRTYSVITRDLSTYDSLKFPHKSFSEYLYAKQFVEEFATKDHEATCAIKAVIERKFLKLVDMPEVVAFISELMHVSSEQPDLKFNKPGVAKLFEYIFIDYLNNPKIMKSFVKAAISVVCIEDTNPVLRSMTRLNIKMMSFLLSMLGLSSDVASEIFSSSLTTPPKSGLIRAVALWYVLGRLLGVEEEEYNAFLSIKSGSSYLNRLSSLYRIGGLLH